MGHRLGHERLHQVENGTDKLNGVLSSFESLIIFIRSNFMQNVNICDITYVPTFTQVAIVGGDDDV